MPQHLAIALMISLVGGSAASTTAPSTQPAFPMSWIGTWRGPCQFTPVKGETKNFEMEVRIAATDEPNRFIWEIVYIDGDKRQVREYELQILDPQTGHCVIDEKNSIKIDSYLVGDTLLSQFTVQKGLITASYRVVDDHMEVQMVSADAAKTTESGGKDGAPEVKSSAIRGVQRGTLERVR
jgi:hypothetical protein